MSDDSWPQVTYGGAPATLVGYRVTPKSHIMTAGPLAVLLQGGKFITVDADALTPVGLPPHDPACTCGH